MKKINSAPRIQARVEGRFKLLIDEFLEIKGLNQKELIEDYLPAVMMAIDHELYFGLYKKYYGNEKLEKIVGQLNSKAD